MVLETLMVSAHFGGEQNVLKSANSFYMLTSVEENLCKHQCTKEAQRTS